MDGDDRCEPDSIRAPLPRRAVRWARRNRWVMESRSSSGVHDRGGPTGRWCGESTWDPGAADDAPDHCREELRASYDHKARPRRANARAKRPLRRVRRGKQQPGWRHQRRRFHHSEVWRSDAENDGSVNRCIWCAQRYCGAFRFRDARR